MRLFKSVLSGETALPSAQDMRAETAKERDESLKAERHYHKMGSDQWQYSRELASMSGADPTPKEVEELYDAVHHRRKRCLQSYKSDRYAMGEDGKYKMVIL